MSEDRGESWRKMSDAVSGGTGPHYYQEIWASPHSFDRVYHADVRLKITDDGGANFRNVGHEYKHSDNHAMAFDPDDPDYLLVGCDGGLFLRSNEKGQAYQVMLDYLEGGSVGGVYGERLEVFLGADLGGHILRRAVACPTVEIG